MKIFFCLFVLIFSSSLVQAESFKIDSFYYIDTAPKPNESDSKIVFNVDREVSCEGNLVNKIFINKDSYKISTTAYLLLRFWPSYFLKQAALTNVEVDLFLGRFEPTLNACEVGFQYEGNSVQRWYEPHEFKVSDIDDTNPINTVYYQLYINARSPTYAPWVYADTDYSVSCDGVTTNRIIPMTNPNEWGYVIPAEFGNTENPGYSSENTRSFFELLSGKINHYTVGRYVPELNGCMIHHIQFSGNNISAEAIEIGKQMCIDAPEVCELFSREELDLALQMGLRDGVDMCIESPASCGLFNQTDMDASYLNGNHQGVQDCINNPEFCGLFNQTDLDLSLAEGIAKGKTECTESPDICDLFDQADMDQAYLSGERAGIVSCITEPARCDLFNIQAVNRITLESVYLALEDIAQLLPKGVIKSVCKKHPDSLLCAYDIDKHKNNNKNKHKDKKKHGHDKHDDKKNRGHGKHDH